MNNIFNLCFVLDRNYIDKLKVTLISLFISNKNNHFLIHIVHHDFKKEDEEDLIRFVNVHSNDSKIVFYNHSVDDFKNLVSMNNNYTAYLKVLIPYIVNIDSELLFLDCDLLVLGDLNELFNLKSNHFLSAVPDSHIIKKRKNHIDLIVGNDCKYYFNSGVMLFNNNYKGEMISQELIFDYLVTNKKDIIFHDQDILNHFYAKQFYILDYKFNTFPMYKFLNSQYNQKGEIVILHYANLKPWKSNYIGKYRKLYKKYYYVIAKEEKLSFMERSNIIAKIKSVINHFMKK